MSTAPQIFHPSRWLPIFLLAVSVLTLLGAVFVYLHHGFNLTVLGLAAFSLLAELGAVDFLLTRVELRDDTLVVVHRFRRREIPRADIESVTWEGGSGVALRMADGTWLKLPDIGNSQARANAIRAWLNADR